MFLYYDFYVLSITRRLTFYIDYHGVMNDNDNNARGLKTERTKTAEMAIGPECLGEAKTLN